MTHKSFRSFSYLIILLIISSCNLDQVEKQYTTYEDAKKDGLFESGWVSSGLISSSMEEIYLKTNLDINTYFFRYKLTKTDLEMLKQKLTPIKSQPFPHGLVIPNLFKTETESLPQFWYVEKDTVFIKVNEENNTVYGWSK